MLRASLPARAAAAPPVAALAAALLALGACDTAPGLSDARNAPPRVQAVALAPATAFREDMAPGSAASTVRLDVAAEAAVSDPENRIDSVLLVVENPARTASGGLLPPLVRTPMAATSGGRYAASARLDVPATAYGAYRVLVVAKDRDGRLGEGVATLTYATRSRAPQVTDVQTTVAGKRITLVATVLDPDGEADLARVEAVPATAPNGPDRFAFAPAGAGRYAVQLDVTGSGTVRFLVRAYDQAGVKSADVLAEAIVL